MPDLADPNIQLFLFLLLASVAGFLLLMISVSGESVEDRLHDLSDKQPKTQHDDLLFDDTNQKSIATVIFPFLDARVRQQRYLAYV